MHLRQRGHAVDVFAPIVRRDKSFPDLIERIRVRGYLPRLPIPIPMREAVSILASSFFSPAFMRKFKSYDALICHGQPSAWIGYQVHRLLKKPYVCYLHQPNRFLYRRPIDAQVGWKVNGSPLPTICIGSCNRPIEEPEFQRDFQWSEMQVLSASMTL